MNLHKELKRIARILKREGYAWNEMSFDRSKYIKTVIIDGMPHIHTPEVWDLRVVDLHKRPKRKKKAQKK